MSEQIPEEVKEAGLDYLRSMSPAQGVDQAPSEAVVNTEAAAPVAPARATEIGGAPVRVLVEHEGVLIPQSQFKDMQDAGQEVQVRTTAGRRG